MPILKRIKLLFFFVIIFVGLFGLMNKDQVILAISKQEGWKQLIFNQTPVPIAGESAVLIDVETGAVVFSKNEDKRMYPASTTKLLTALVVLDKSSVDEVIKVGDEVLFHTEGEARAGLFEGQVMTVKEMIGAMLLPSGNDAARSLAVYIAKKDSGNVAMGLQEGMNYFANLMNEKAMALGAHDSQFTNAHGLHNEEHYSTAYDLAIIARQANQMEVINRIVHKESFSTKTHSYMNRNKLLDPGSDYFYQDATGMKTGFTSQAGYCLVSSAERDGRQLIAVVLNAGKETVWGDSISLLNYGFEH